MAQQQRCGADSRAAGRLAGTTGSGTRRGWGVAAGTGQGPRQAGDADAGGADRRSTFELGTADAGGVRGPVAARNRAAHCAQTTADGAAFGDSRSATADAEARV